MAITSTLSLDKLRPRNLDADSNRYFRELERLLKDMSDQINAITPGDPLTADNVSVTVDTINITADQVTL